MGSAATKLLKEVVEAKFATVAHKKANELFELLDKDKSGALSQSELAVFYEPCFSVANEYDGCPPKKEFIEKTKKLAAELAEFEVGKQLRGNAFELILKTLFPASFELSDRGAITKIALCELLFFFA